MRRDDGGTGKQKQKLQLTNVSLLTERRVLVEWGRKGDKGHENFSIFPTNRRQASKRASGNPMGHSKI